MSRAQLPPLVVGTLAVLAVAVHLAASSPGPGPLAGPHASIGEDLARCARCHAEEGLVAGCLGCHGEIAAQIREDEGYHAFLLRGKEPQCKECHPDHLGRDFAITPALPVFDHPHVAFALAGAHADLACDRCHARAGTFLGLKQACASCHENVHREERFLDCAGCHDQTTFARPQGFAHDRLPLVNGHEGVSCARCHGEGREWASVRGRTCAECHASPHRADLGRSCEECHARDAAPWREGAAAVDAAVHARTGFPLAKPHDIGCAKCHEGATFAVRFRSPPRPPSSCAECHADVHEGRFGARACTDCHGGDRWKGARFEHASFPLRLAHAEARCDACHRSAEAPARTCAGCHEDPHRGQFAGASCDGCHTEASFRPSLFGAKRHVTFALEGAHREVACGDCHADGRFRGAPRECAGCHEDRHAGQFGKAACDSCHGVDAFRPARFGVERHATFPLSGAHGAVACDRCHEGGGFRGTPRSCRQCHEDPHGAQFGAIECSACHSSDAFAIRPFDHAGRTGHALEGAHAEAACARCHVERKGVRAYRGTPSACAACHTDVHRGQLEGTRCESCHTSREEWSAKGFDHAKTRFPLDRAHAAAACARCHAPVRQPDGSAAIQYRPLSTECRSCHAVK